VRLTLGIVVAAALLSGCASTRTMPAPLPAPPAPPGAPRPEAPEAAPALAGREMARLALSLIGTPYRNGGSDPDGFDCSGFVQYVAAQVGAHLPRSVREQFLTGQPVGDIQPGDLVFFAIDGERVSHVAIAISSTTFVHAPSRRGSVRVDRLDADYWSRRYAGARRLAGAAE
jgi:cell wall-associated NlpC family hydrolase